MPYKTIYIRKDPHDYKKRGPKQKIALSSVEICQQVYELSDLGVTKKAITERLGLTYYVLKKILEDRELHERDAFDLEIAALDKMPADL